jgi:translation initiation factor IF-2
MSEVTVRSLAKVLNLPVEKLLEQLSGAGMQFTGPDQVVSSTEKMKLLGFLRRTHGKDEKPAEEAGPSRITLQRRKVEELTVGGGKTKATVAVEVRQKRTYVKRADVAPSGPDAEREEAARKLAELALREGGVDDDEKIAYLWKRALSRNPDADEFTIIKGLLARRRDDFRDDPQAASELLDVGIAPRDKSLDASELAAWTATTRAVLNLHEAIARY